MFRQARAAFAFRVGGGVDTRPPSGSVGKQGGPWIEIQVFRHNRSHRVAFHALKAHGQPRIVTGVAVTNNGLRLPNRRQVRIAEDQKLFDDLPLGREKLIVARRLTGRLFEASQIDAGWRVRAEAMAALRDDIQRKIGR